MFHSRSERGREGGEARLAHTERGEQCDSLTCGEVLKAFEGYLELEGVLEGGWVVQYSHIGDLDLGHGARQRFLALPPNSRQKSARFFLKVGGVKFVQYKKSIKHCLH